MGLDAVGDLPLRIILTNLGPKHTAVFACVSKRFRLSASEESLWSFFCFQDLNLSAPLDPQSNPAPSFKATYRLWREAFGMYPWPLVKRVKRCWDRLKNWLSANFPEAEATLRKGASEAEIQDLEKLLKVKLPLPTRILYRFCDGQDIRAKDLSTTVHRSPLGLIGGYSFGGHVVNVYLLPLHEVVKETREIIHHLVIRRTLKLIVVAVSSTNFGKFFFLNCINGQLYVGTRHLAARGDMIPCVPHALISSVHDFNSDQQQDAMLLWLEEHGRRLQNGIIKLRDEGNIKSISQFPEKSPLCSTAVTNGVQVRASAVLVPEASDPGNNLQKYCFAYSIRMSLLQEGCIINGMCFSSCQLHRRHWIFRANDAVVSNVNSEAVIGKVQPTDFHAGFYRLAFPLLVPGEEEFVYESYSPLPSSSGSVEGFFTFVPGRLADPKGSPFEVEVARFPLEVPEYIF